ncbi:MAG: DNA primase, partial [Nitrospinaceae bacterium]
MKSFIPEHILEDIRNRADIVEVISDYVPLKSGGKNFKGLCPFHTEKTPSFTANREKQIYHCFGCGAGGNVFRFLMQIEDVPFMEAVRRLASRYQVSLPAGTVRKEGGRSWNEKEVLFRLNGRAAEFYRQQCLDPRTGKSAREYLSARKIDDATAAKFQLGWAPDQWRVLGPHLKQVEKAANGLLVQAGLSLKKEKESGPDVYYDRFRGRLMFPIADAQG